LAIISIISIIGCKSISIKYGGCRVGYKEGREEREGVGAGARR